MLIIPSLHDIQQNAALVVIDMTGGFNPLPFIRVLVIRVLAF